MRTMLSCEVSCGIAMPGIFGVAFGTDSPRAASQRFMKLISSDCELLIRAPNERRSLFCVCDGIIAVISTACAWCRIIPCMNSTSAGERGGRMARVDDGSVLLGAPGAPGCTTTGLARSVCCGGATGEKKKAENLVGSHHSFTPP